MTEPGSEKAIPLIVYSTSSQIFDINPKAIDYLKSLAGPIGVISVAGRYRTGKSYLLNRVFLSRRSGFSVGPTVNPCTKGLWIWNSPVQGRTKDGRPCHIIIIDSEGIGALDTDTDHDTRIFSLAILLSSCFVYNSVGAIDENAINNLSLVVNITKHVHINASQSGIQSYSEYFPEFMWVVRDFTLRLVDPSGRSISPKEYLENSLLPHNSNENDEKNKIRKHLTGYFKERDCTTLVRPIEKEEDLQNLDNLELSALRSEFAEQVLVLRDKVLFRIKPKSLNGKELNGEMFANLVTSYVNAMNSGVVPNIESSWSIVCKLQNKKIQEEAKEIYEKSVKNNKKGPLDAENLKKIHQKAKNSGLEYLKQNLVVEDEKIIQELSNYFSQRYKIFKEENLNMSKAEFSNFLKDSFCETEAKVKSGEIKTVADFEKALKMIEKDYETRVTGPGKKEYFLEFSKEKLLRFSDSLIHSLSNELNIHKDLTSDQISRMEKELKTTSDLLNQEKASVQKNANFFANEKSEFLAKEKNFKDQINLLMMDKEKLENSLKETSEALKHKNQVELEKVTLKNNELVENIKELERELVRKKSEIEEQKALMGQKLKMLESSVEEYKSKEKSASEKLKDSKNENVQNAKVMQSKYEALIAKLQEKIDHKSHDFKDLQAEIDSKDSVIEELKQNISEKQILFAKEKAENLNLIDTLQRKLKQKEDEVQLKLNYAEQDRQNEFVKLKYKLEDTERKLKHCEEELRASTENFNQEIAILSQKNEFFEQEIEEHKAKRQEEKRMYEARVFNLENMQTSKPDPNLQKMKAEQSEEISRLMKDHETEKASLASKIDDLTDLKNELEMKLKLERNEFTHKEKQLKELLNEALATKSKLLLDLASVTTQVEDPKLRGRVNELEKELENLAKAHIDEIESVKAKNELTINQLKNFFDQEKARIEQKLIDEKNKHEKRVSEIAEEFEEKISSERASHNEEIAILNEECAGLESYYSGEINTLTDSLELNQERINDLENHISQLKEQINAINSANATNSQSQIEQFNIQKIELLKKIDSLSEEISVKDKNLITCKYEIEKISNSLHTKSKELEDLSGKYSKEKSELTEKVLSLNEKYETLYNENIKMGNKYKRDLALANNEIELVNKRCKDLEDLIQDQDRKKKESFDLHKGDSNVFANFNLQRLEKEITNLEKKLDEKKKNFKVLESTSNKQIAALERERAVLEEKLSYSERKRTELEQYYQETISNLNEQLKNKPAAKESSINENESLKLQIGKLERDINSKQISYDRDKSLWENKFNFLVQQRDYSRKELATAQEKFDQIIDELKKKHSADREKQENSSKTLISSLENRYNSQMNEMQTRYDQSLREIREKNRSLEKNIQNLTEDIDNERRERLNLSASLDKKLQQSIENEKKIQKDLQIEKNSKEETINSMLEKFSKEREEWKLKFMDSERKYKEIEQQKSQIFVQSEKDRVKLTLEKEDLLGKILEMQKEINDLAKKKEEIKRENDKLKTSRPRVGRKGEAGLSFDDFKTSRAQSGRSTPTNSTIDSPRIKAFPIPATIKRSPSKEATKENS